MESLITRIHALVPDAICSTRDNEITGWDDIRQQPSEAELLAVDVDSIIAAEQAKVQETEDELVNSPLTSITYAQAEAYIDSQVTDLASAKVAMKKIAKLLLAVAKKQGLSS